MSALTCGCDPDCQTGPYYCSLHAEKSEQRVFRLGPDEFAQFASAMNAPSADNPRLQKLMREFATGARRGSDADKLDYDGFLSPLALEAFAKYMHTHRIQADGQPRASDNWQKGIPVEAYRKSLIRHVMDFWALARGHVTEQVKQEAATEIDLLCAIWFNVQGILHERLKVHGGKNEL